MPDLWRTGVHRFICALMIAVLAVAAANLVTGGEDSAEVLEEEPVEFSWPGTLQVQPEDDCPTGPVCVEGLCQDAGEDPHDVLDGIGGVSVSHQHVVRPGDTLSQIAIRFGVSVNTLALTNGLSNPNLIRVGHVLRIPPTDGIYYEVAPGDTLWGISRRYGVDVHTIVQKNGLGGSSLIRPGELLFLPTGGGGSAAVTAGESRALLWPLPIAGRISSPFGPRWGGFHYGVDIAVPAETQVLAAAAGRVVAAGWKGTYGLTVRLDHGGGCETFYAHASRITVSVGDTISARQPIALVGSTGRSTGPHLHMEVRFWGEPTDPMRHLRR
ncbi:MAG: M23 family metallopeptidase [Bacillota bacterium]